MQQKKIDILQIRVYKKTLFLIHNSFPNWKNIFYRLGKYLRQK